MTMLPGRRLTFFIPGIPKGRAHTRAIAEKRGGQYTGRTRSIPEKTADQAEWFAAIRRAGLAMIARNEWEIVPRSSGAVFLTVEWILPLRKEDLKGRRQRVYTSIDTDNLVKALKDRLTGILWQDDVQVEDGAMPRRRQRDPGEATGAIVRVVYLGRFEDQALTDPELATDCCLKWLDKHWVPDGKFEPGPVKEAFEALRTIYALLSSHPAPRKET